MPNFKIFIPQLAIPLFFACAYLMMPSAAQATKPFCVKKMSKLDLSTNVPKKYLAEMTEKFKPFEGNDPAGISVTYHLGDYLKPGAKVVVLDYRSGDLIRITYPKGKSEVLKLYSEIHSDDYDAHLGVMMLLQELSDDNLDTGFELLNVEKVKNVNFAIRQDDILGVDLRKLLEDSDADFPDYKSKPLSPELKKYLRRLYDDNVTKLKAAMKQKGWKFGRTMFGTDGTWTIGFTIPGSKTSGGLLHPQVSIAPWCVQVQFDGKSIRMVYLDSQ